MLRDKLMHREAIDGFRWRSHEISRVEGFSDAVFGFAVTLLIVSLEVPKTSTELLETMRGFGAFVITFFMLASLWYSQFTFFRRYGLEDRVTVVLNLALMFMVLFFVYPLKFLFGVLLTDMRMRQMHGVERVVLPEHKPIIFAIFGAGFVGVMTIFMLLYRHAWKNREKLGLNAFEAFETQHSIRRLTMAVAIGSTYFVIAALEFLPEKTPQQKMIAKVAAIGVLILIFIFFGRMIGLMRERKRVAKEWKVQQAELARAEAPQEHHPDE